MATSNNDEHDELYSIFSSLATQGPDGEEFIKGKALLSSLRTCGLTESDPRLAETLSALEELGGSGAQLSFDDFADVVNPAESLIRRALTGGLVIPDFERFAHHITTIYNEVKEDVHGGANAAYIPQLAKVDPENFAVSVCTVDGQQFSVGDFGKRFSIQSCSKVVTYAMALEEHGIDAVHHHVGREPSGGKFNKLTMLKRPTKPVERDEAGVRVPPGVIVDGRGEQPGLAAAAEESGLEEEGRIPHNPMINAGAIMTASLVKPSLDLSARMDHTLQTWRRLCNAAVAVNTAVFLSERATADRNFCLAHWMQELGSFPHGTNIKAACELYFNICSIAITNAEMARVAGTLSNGGANPFTRDRVFDPDAVQCALSVMLSCGLYDASGTFQFRVGLPAKSGVGGCIMAVIPGVCGISVWSPPLDGNGNSVRAQAFFERLAARFSVHLFGGLPGMAEVSKKADLVSSTRFGQEEACLELLLAASSGDLPTLRALAGSGTDVNVADYDKRTALHIAAADGHYEAVAFLLEHGARVNAGDRWNATPLCDAEAGQSPEIADLLRRHGARREPDAVHAQPDSLLDRRSSIGETAFTELLETITEE